jgi:hypothetical protein
MMLNCCGGFLALTRDQAALGEKINTTPISRALLSLRFTIRRPSYRRLHPQGQPWQTTATRRSHSYSIARYAQQFDQGGSVILATWNTLLSVVVTPVLIAFDLPVPVTLRVRAKLGSALASSMVVLT